MYNHSFSAKPYFNAQTKGKPNKEKDEKRGHPGKGIRMAQHNNAKGKNMYKLGFCGKIGLAFYATKLLQRCRRIFLISFSIGLVRVVSNS